MAKIIRGEKRGRPGRWLVDYRDATGRRHRDTYLTRREAEDRLAEVLRQTQPLRATVDPRITVEDYAETIWLPRVTAAGAKARTLVAYRTVLRLHILPTLGKVAVRQVDRRQAGHLLEQLLAHKARRTVRVVLAVLRALLSSAVANGILLANPCSGLGRELRLGLVAAPEPTKALDAEQVEVLLAAIRSAPSSYDRRLAPLFLVLARTGVRIGEALGLQWDDVDLVGRQLLIRRQLGRGQVTTPKSGRERTVSASWEVVAVLRKHQTDTKAETLKRGWAGGVPAWVFVSTEGTPLDETKVRKAMKRALRRAGLPGYFSPHSLRHSFASLLLSRGESPQFVQEQLGHQSLELTTRTYGRWLPKRPLHGGVDALDEGNGNKRSQLAASLGLSGGQAPGSSSGHTEAPGMGLLTTGSFNPPTEQHPAAQPRPLDPRNPEEAPCLLALLACPGGWLGHRQVSKTPQAGRSPQGGTNG